MDASDLNVPGGKIEPVIGDFAACAEPVSPVERYMRIDYEHVEAQCWSNKDTNCERISVGQKIRVSLHRGYG